MQGSGAGIGAAAQEWLYASGGQPELAVVDGAFLMELLEDAPVADQAAPEDFDRLSRVIRSLEAEIGGGGPPPSAPADGGCTAEHVTGDVYNVGLEEYMLSELDSIPGPCVAEAPFEYWTEVPPEVGHDMGGWYVDGDGLMVGPQAMSKASGVFPELYLGMNNTKIEMKIVRHADPLISQVFDQIDLIKHRGWKRLPLYATSVSVILVQVSDFGYSVQPPVSDILVQVLVTLSLFRPSADVVRDVWLGSLGSWNVRQGLRAEQAIVR
ncbi:hypothetical protein BAE44_0006536 [Dichanthelium oligosanthes]|uniref:Uncharacterized protein n=1 Tax=Dichanthelium oligosanthes TaxID=888268 RepID=A0A1E5W536_9POAL|nr:hypothetical protein BAE44_0006536 [Dichanthelium oligosanthes]